MSSPQESAEADLLAMLQSLQTDLHANLALTRVALGALATFSTGFGHFLDEVLNAEIDAAESLSSPTSGFPRNVRETLIKSTEARDGALELEQALVRAASALGGSDPDQEPPS